MAEIFFETFNVPAFYVSIQAVLSLLVYLLGGYKSSLVH